MKLRTLDQLQDQLDRDFSWRIREISDVKLSAKVAKSYRQTTLIRAGVPLLYAHWEGFVKSSAEAYISFVSFQRLKLNQLSSNFVAIATQNYISSLVDDSMSGKGSEAINYLREQMNSRAQLSNSMTVNTRSNLNSNVFEKIAGTIGIDPARYSTRYQFIDSSLLKQRNSIAHGEYLALDLVSYSNLSDNVVQLLRWIKDDIQNGASTGAFRYRDLSG